MANNMLNEALNTYQVIAKDKTFANAGRLKINIGNIYLRKKDWTKAIKHYRMALDQVPKVQQRTRSVSTDSSNALTLLTLSRTSSGRKC